MNICWLGIGLGFKLENPETILQGDGVHRHQAVQERNGLGTGIAATLNLTTLTELSGELKLSSLHVEQIEDVQHQSSIPKQD